MPAWLAALITAILNAIVPIIVNKTKEEYQADKAEKAKEKEYQAKLDAAIAAYKAAPPEGKDEAFKNWISVARRH